MIIVIFRSRRTVGCDDEYGRTAKRMTELASATPGFVSFKTFANPDGERVSIIEFESEAAVAAWRDHPEHRQAQRRGREAFYECFSVQTCREIRRIDFKR